ncbi:MAG: prepilin peptidase [Phycisphaerales bacterium]|nr:prepilin peptidase [Phycisphaerales bacterium]
MPPGLIMLLPKLTTLLFVIAAGACVGSLINVLVYRMPLGLNVVTPASRCPSCNHKLTWRENIPIFGWVLLRGKCRFCKCKISPEYPIVELIVALLFGAIYALWYVVPADASLLGVPIGQIAPEWARNGAGHTWPQMVVLLVLVGSLVAMTIIDARTCMIPLTLTRVPVVVALLFTVGHAVWFQYRAGSLTEIAPGIWSASEAARRFRWGTAPGEVWTIATGGVFGWKFIGVALGGTLGLVVSNLLLKLRVISPSFADYDEWAEAEMAKHNAANPESQSDRQEPEPSSQDQPTDDAAMWIRYPHARREMIRELAFLLPPVAFGILGGKLFAAQFGGPDIQAAPLWLVALGGVLMGYLIGGGVVWAVRVFGSLAFGKEAMGLGDVHMMAAVGACLGWIDPTIAFFLAAFVGVGYAILAKIFSGKLSRTMPYGPFLAVATLLVIFAKPLIELGLGEIFHNTGGLNIP